MAEKIEPVVTIEDLCAVLEASLAHVSNAELAAFIAVETERKVLAGFRADKPELLRKMLARKYPDPFTFPKNFQALLQRLLPDVALLLALNIETITRLRRSLMTLWGKPRFIFALCVAGEESRLALAREWMLETGAVLPELEKAQAFIEKPFAALGRSGEMTPERQIQLSSLREELTTTQAELRVARNHEIHARQAREQLATAQARIAKLEAELAVSKQQIRFANVALDKAQAEVAREQSQRELRVSAEVAHHLTTEFHGWLTPKAQPVDASLPVLLEEVEAALEEQFKLDERVKAQRSVIKLAETQAALSEALIQSPRLVKACKALRQQCQQETHSPFFTEVRQRIDLSNQTEFTTLRGLITTLQAVQLISTDEQQELMGAFHRRAATWTLVGEITDKDKQSEDLMAANALACKYPALSKALQRKGRAIILVDGHNMVFALPGRYSPQRGQAMHESDKRDALIRDMKRLVLNTPATRVHIVFDGPERTDTSPAENINVSYSGGKGEHRADNVLVDKCRFFKLLNDQDPSMATPVLIVTNDNDLRARAARLDAIPISVRDFAAFIPQYQAPSQS